MDVLFIIVLGIGALIWFFSQKSNPQVSETEPISEKSRQLLEKYDSFFSSLFPYPLTEEQRVAIVDESERALVIASAGSGKTLTILGKYAYLLESGLAIKEEILVLAFNKKVAIEIKKKLEGLISETPDVETFHAFGRKILTSAEHTSPSLDNWAIDDKDGVLTTQNIRSLVERAKFKHPEIEQWITEFRSLCPHHDIESFVNNQDEYNEAISSYPYRRKAFQLGETKRPLYIPALDGKTWVRSQQELLIANSLIAKGIKFEYERPYPNLVDQEYRPDFYYPEIDLWHEHFALDRAGNSPFEGYEEEYKWKKSFHEDQNTKTLFTYSYEYSEDIILEKMFKKFKEEGLVGTPLSQQKIDQALQSMYTDDTYMFIRQSIKLAKTNNLNRQELKLRYDAQTNKFRSNRFKKFFLPLFDTYQQHLEENKTIDFEDMINKASTLFRASEYKDRYKYILVDEFQDLSVCRTEFLNSLLATSSYLFGVGDDWQSIYRFTGSDIAVMSDFNNKFQPDISFVHIPGYEQPNEEIKTQQDKDTNYLHAHHSPNEAIKLNFKQYKIQKTFRTCEDISKVASGFIIKNDNQIPKTIKPRTSKTPLNPLPGALNICEVEEYNNKYILKILNRIPKAKPNTKKPSVFILGRKNSDFASIKPEWLMKKRQDLYIEKSTIHKAKGLESDIVIFLGLDGGMRGFPNSIGEDPLVSMFLPKEDNYPNSEERRVMYVGMTRARDSLFLVHKALDPSSFVGNVETIALEQNITVNKMNFRSKVIKRCHECKRAGRKGGMVIRRATGAPGERNRYRLFLGCNHWRPPPANSENDPLFCDNTDEAPCPKCLQEGNPGFLYVESIQEGEKRRLYAFCRYCKFKKSFFDF